MNRRGLPVSAAVAAILAIAAAALRGGFGAADPAAGYRAWSDAFFIAGALVGGVGLLAFAASDGLFDIIRFGVGKAVRIVLSKERRDAYPKTFYDYRMQRRGAGMNGLSAALVGAACLALGAVFLLLWSRC